MTETSQKKKIFGIGVLPAVLIFIVALMVIGTVGSLYSFGFFEPVTVSETYSSSKIVLGKPFKGDARSEEFGEIFTEVGRMTESGAVNGLVCGMYFNNPEKEKGIIDAFIGVMVADSNVTAPEGYVYKVIPERAVLEAHMKADYRVATVKCYQAIFDHSKANNIKITDEFFEWFINKEEAYVQVVKK